MVGATAFLETADFAAGFDLAGTVGDAEVLTAGAGGLTATGAAAAAGLTAVVGRLAATAGLADIGTAGLEVAFAGWGGVAALATLAAGFREEGEFFDFIMLVCGGQLVGISWRRITEDGADRNQKIPIKCAIRS